MPVGFPINVKLSFVVPSNKMFQNPSADPSILAPGIRPSSYAVVSCPVSRYVRLGIVLSHVSFATRYREVGVDRPHAQRSRPVTSARWFSMAT